MDVARPASSEVGSPYGEDAAVQSIAAARRLIFADYYPGGLVEAIHAGHCFAAGIDLHTVSGDGPARVRVAAVAKATGAVLREGTQEEVDAYNLAMHDSERRPPRAPASRVLVAEWDE